METKGLKQEFPNSVIILQTFMIVTEFVRPEQHCECIKKYIFFWQNWAALLQQWITMKKSGSTKFTINIYTRKNNIAKYIVSSLLLYLSVFYSVPYRF